MSSNSTSSHHSDWWTKPSPPFITLCILFVSVVIGFIAAMITTCRNSTSGGGPRPSNYGTVVDVEGEEEEEPVVNPFPANVHVFLH
jgi:hypothetical protein